jgi:hypothetical protein
MSIAVKAEAAPRVRGGPRGGPASGCTDEFVCYLSVVSDTKGLGAGFGGATASLSTLKTR